MTNLLTSYRLRDRSSHRGPDIRPDFHVRPAALVAALHLLAAVVLCLTGCQSPEKSHKPFASVVIIGNTPGQIRQAAIEVFATNGYKAIITGISTVTFEKRATALSNFTYGSWLSDDPIWIRVKALIVPAGEMTFRLECSAFRVKDRNGATEEEAAISRVQRGAYQKLLDEIAQRLNRGSAGDNNQRPG